MRVLNLLIAVASVPGATLAFHQASPVARNIGASRQQIILCESPDSDGEKTKTKSILFIHIMEGTLDLSAISYWLNNHYQCLCSKQNSWGNRATPIVP